jgi:hypothetical protein
MPRRRQFADLCGNRNDPTAAARMKKMRLTKAGHVEELCPVCSAEFGRQMHCPRFDGVTLDAERRKDEAWQRSRAITRKCMGLDLKDEFKKLTGVAVTTREATRAVWKKHAAAIHPDRNPEKAAEAAHFGELCPFGRTA